MATAPTYVVVGGGITGMAAARTLCKYGKEGSPVVLVEAEKRLGGHTYTVEAAGEVVDVGFMVMNDLTYPNLNKFFSDIGAFVEPSDMSFSVFEDTKRSKGGKEGEDPFSWSFQSSSAWLLRNAWKPRLWKLITAHGEFSKRGQAFLANPTPLDLSMREKCHLAVFR